MVSTWADKSPGVYREDTFLKPEPKLPTGVAGFVGFAKPRDPEKRPVAPYTPIALHHREDFALYFEADEEGYLAEAVSGFFGNGGVRCYVAYVEPAYSPTEAKETLEKAVDALAPLHDLDVIAVPDAVTLETDAMETDAMAELQGWLLTHCAEQGDRFALLDVPEDVSPKRAGDRAAILKAGVRAAAMNGALYYPWVKGRASDRAVPPCGHIAGIFARSDARVGVFKAPANEEVLGAVDLETEVTSAM